jgi:hypothetical protein
MARNVHIDAAYAAVPSLQWVMAGRCGADRAPTHDYPPSEGYSAAGASRTLGVANHTDQTELDNE